LRRAASAISPSISSRNVFGDVVGDVVGRQLTTPKRAWETAVLKAHGHTPDWGTGGKLSAASRAQLRRIDLRFHDLRHEAGSRLIGAAGRSTTCRPCSGTPT
jgi:hypothetical protein